MCLCETTNMSRSGAVSLRQLRCSNPPSSTGAQSQRVRDGPAVSAAGLIAAAPRPSPWPRCDIHESRPHDWVPLEKGCRQAERTQQVFHRGIHLVWYANTSSGSSGHNLSELLTLHISGTYGKVYKALPISQTPTDRPDDPPLPPIVAIKKFKPDKEGDVVTYTGLSQSAIREISLNRELSRGFVLHKAQSQGKVLVIKRKRRNSATEDIERQLEAYPSDSDSQQDDQPLASLLAKKADHGTEEQSHEQDRDLPPCENFARLVEVILEEKSVYMVFEYAEHDLLVSSSAIPHRRLYSSGRALILANHPPSSSSTTRQHTHSDSEITPPSTSDRHRASSRA